jgi:hypothetical protein
MTDPTTRTTVRTRLAAPDRHPPKRFVALPLSRFGGRRPASAIRARSVVRAAGPII